MENSTFRNLVLAAAAVSLLAVGATAFAGWGRGYGRHMGWGGGPGNCAGYGYGPGAVQGGTLSEEQVQAIEEERRAFRNSTEGLRRSIYEQELALRNELAKEQPDAGKAAALQKELSALQSELDAQRIEHRLKMQKIAPDAGRGFMMGRGGRMGYGPGKGRGGYGPRGGGYMY